DTGRSSPDRVHGSTGIAAVSGEPLVAAAEPDSRGSNRSGGEFDFNMEVTPDPVEAGDPNVPEREVVPRIFMDFIQKIGLKLESQKTAVEIVVVDQAEKPGETRLVLSAREAQ